MKITLVDVTCNSSKLTKKIVNKVCKSNLFVGDEINFTSDEKPIKKIEIKKKYKVKLLNIRIIEKKIIK